MGNYANTITTTCKGVDQTKAAFNSATANASKFSQKLQGTMASGAGKLGGVFSSIGKGALAVTAAVGAAAMATSKFISTAKEMSEITDRANDAGLASGQIMKLTNAFSELGMKGASIDKTADIFQKMAKSGAGTTLSDFGTLLRQVSQLGTETERVAALTDIFGRANAEALAPLLRDGPEAVNQIFNLGDSFAVASETAMNAGDKLADNWNRICNTSKQAWYNFVGYFIDAFSTGTSETNSSTDSMGQKFVDVMGKMGIAAGAVVQGFITIWKYAQTAMTGIFETIGNAWNEFVSWFTGEDYDFGHYQSEIWDETKDSWAETTQDMLSKINGIKDAWNSVGSEASKASGLLTPAMEDTEASIHNVEKASRDLEKATKQAQAKAPKARELQLAEVAVRGTHAAQVAEWRATTGNSTIPRQQLKVTENILTAVRPIAPSLAPLGKFVAGLTVF